METPRERLSEPNSAQAADHIAGAREMLQALQDKIGEHPELAAAILKLEMALNVLSMKTGGLL